MKCIAGSLLMIFLITGCDNDPKTIEVTTPRSVSEKAPPLDKKTLILTIYGDQSLSWQPGNIEDSTLATKISPVTVENIKAVVTKYKKDLGAESDKIKILLKESSQTGHERFKIIVQALKEMDIYKFNIVTIPVN